MSTKLDCWTQEEVTVAEGVGNERANYYWESKREGKPLVITHTSSQSERRGFIKDKYIRKMWINEGISSPYDAVLNGKIEKDYSQSGGSVFDKDQSKSNKCVKEDGETENQQPSTNKQLL